MRQERYKAPTEQHITSINTDYVRSVQRRETQNKSRKIRLIRRLIRDLQTRGESAEGTVKYWDIVCKGEDKYVARFTNLNMDPFEVSSDLVVHNEKLLVGGIWCIMKLEKKYSNFIFNGGNQL